MPWRNQVERAFVATLGSSAFHPDGEVPKDPPTHQHNKVLVEWKSGQMATKNDCNYLTYTNLMFKLAIKNGAKHKCIPPRQNHGAGSWVLPRPLAVEIDGKWIVWKTQKGLWWLWGGQVLKRFQYISGEKISSWRVYTTRKTSWSWSDRFSFLGNFSRGICCPTAEYEINEYLLFIIYFIMFYTSLE